MNATARARVSVAVAAVAGLLAFCWPLLLTPGAVVSAQLAPLVFAGVLVVVLAVVLAELSAAELDAKTLAMLGVLAAVGTILRPLGAGTAGFELVFFVIILAGRAYGAGFGFILGALSLFTSALITSGAGPWLPYQMLAAGFVGLFAGLLPRLRGAAEIVLLAGYGMVSAFLYGWLMDFSFWPFALGDGTQLSFDPALGPWANLQRFAWYNLATSMGWNVGRALTNAVLIVALGAPLLRLLRRTGRRAEVVQAAIAAPEAE